MKQGARVMLLAQTLGRLGSHLMHGHRPDSGRNIQTVCPSTDTGCSAIDFLKPTINTFAPAPTRSARLACTPA